MKYVNKYIQQLPIFKEDSINNRDNWNKNRSLCKDNCCWGVPFKVGQKITIHFETDFLGYTVDFENTDVLDFFDNNFNIVGFSNSTFETTQTVFQEDGVLKEFITVSFNISAISPNNCKQIHIKMDLIDGDKYYSEVFDVYESDVDLHMLNIKGCKIGGIHRNSTFDYEVYLHPDTLVGEPEYIVLEEFIEDGNGDEIPLIKKQDKRYRFDTGYVPEFYADFLNTARGLTNESSKEVCNITFSDDSTIYPIKKVENDIVTDGDGCFVNNEFSFILDETDIKGCCTIDMLSCWDLDFKEITDYNILEINAVESFGNIYVVPFSTNPQQFPTWEGHEDELAEWNGTQWVFTVGTDRQLLKKIGTSEFLLFNDYSETWELTMSTVYRIIDANPLSVCESTLIYSLIPLSSFGKIQYSSDGVVWIDHGTYVNSDTLKAGVSYGSVTNLEFRVDVLDIGCSTPITQTTMAYNCDDK